MLNFLVLEFGQRMKLQICLFMVEKANYLNEICFTLITPCYHVEMTTFQNDGSFFGSVLQQLIEDQNEAEKLCREIQVGYKQW